MRSWGVCVTVISPEFKRTSSALCFKVQLVALNSPGFLQNSLSLFAVAPGSEASRFIWFYGGTKELLCSVAPFPLNGLCDKTNFGGVKVPGLLDQSSPFATPCGEWKPQDWLWPCWKVAKELITPGTYKRIDLWQWPVHCKEYHSFSSWIQPNVKEPVCWV